MSQLCCRRSGPQETVCSANNPLPGDPAEIPEVTLKAPASGLPIAQLLKQAGLVPSTSEALRLIAQGAVRVDGGKVSDKALALDAGAVVVVLVGKRKFARVSVTE